MAESDRPATRTIGHGTRTTEEPVTLLRSAGISTPVDVRRHTLGRRQPHLAKERLAVDLPANGITYDACTGTPAFRSALAKLERRADAVESIAVAGNW